MATPRPRSRPSNRLSTTNTATPRGDADFNAHTISTPRYTALGTPAALRSASRRTPRAAPLTPFGLRAIQRRVANTPGRDRRKSSRGPQQESAFDILRNLGRTLAPVSKPIHSSPHEQPTSSPDVSEEGEEDETIFLDKEPLPERPRLSLPITDSGTSENGSPDMPPPRLSLQFDEDDITQRSVEYPRRAISEQDRQRMERMSFGNVRMSENFGDLTQLDVFSEPGDTTTVFPQDDEAGIEQSQLDEAAFDAGGETADLGRFNLDFNFPSPVAQAAELDPLPNEEDDFMLQTEEQAEIPYPPSADGDDAAAGGFTGFDRNTPDQASDAASAEARPSVVGGGLRDEPLTAKNRKQKKLSRHGIPVPILPKSVVKKLATRFARVGAGTKAKINKDTLAAIEQASEWFFEQASEDLATYAKHAGRKTVDESDVMTLMRRQRLVNNMNTVFSLAQKNLPKELLQDIRLSMPPHR